MLQTVPVHPGAQLHKKPATWSVHVPPFWQGLLAHSSISKEDENGLCDRLNFLVILAKKSFQFNLSRSYWCPYSKILNFTVTNFSPWQIEGKSICPLNRSWLTGYSLIYLPESKWSLDLKYQAGVFPQLFVAIVRLSIVKWYLHLGMGAVLLMVTF